MNKHTERIPTTGMSREEWLTERKNGIGGSDAGAVCGLNPYRSPSPSIRTRQAQKQTTLTANPCVRGATWRTTWQGVSWNRPEKKQDVQMSFTKAGNTPLCMPTWTASSLGKMLVWSARPLPPTPPTNGKTDIFPKAISSSATTTWQSQEQTHGTSRSSSSGKTSSGTGLGGTKASSGTSFPSKATFGTAMSFQKSCRNRTVRNHQNVS